MKSCIFLCVALLWLAATAGAAADNNPSQPAGPYHSAALGYTLNFPAGWYSMTPIPLPGVTLPPHEDFCNTPDVNASPLVCVSVTTLPAGTALKDQRVVDEVRGDEDEDKFSVDQDKPVKRGKFQGRALQGKNVADGDPQYYYALVLQSPTQHGLVVLRIEGPPAAMQDAAMQAEVQQLLDSFRAD